MKALLAARPKLAWQLPVALVGIALGFLVTLQIKAQLTYKEAIAPGRRLTELTAAWQQTEARRRGLEAEVAALRDKVRSLGGNPEQAPPVVPGRIVDARLLAGLTAVSGPGVVVTLSDDADRSLAPISKGLIADDLLKVVNELRIAGAEAVSLNGERLIAQSEIVNAGGGIMVNQKRLAAPFTIHAIGDSAGLAAGLKAKGGVLETLQFYAIQVTISPQAHVEVPAFQGRIDLRFAKPAARDK